MRSSRNCDHANLNSTEVNFWYLLCNLHPMVAQTKYCTFWAGVQVLHTRHYEEIMITSTEHALKISINSCYNSCYARVECIKDVFFYWLK